MKKVDLCVSELFLLVTNPNEGIIDMEKMSRKLCKSRWRFNCFIDCIIYIYIRLIENKIIDCNINIGAIEKGVS